MKKINNLLIVDVPENSHTFNLTKFDTHAVLDYKQTLCNVKLDRSINHGDFNEILLKCEIVGKLSEISEEDCKRFVDKPFKNKYYLDYNTDIDYIYELKSAKESLISLLQANGIDTNNEDKILIIEVL